MNRFRLIVAALLLTIVASGCTSTGQLALPRSGAAFAPFMAGISAGELDGYLSWWRGSGGTYSPRATTGLLPIDPRCPLRFDYELYRSQRQTRPEIVPSSATDNLYFSDVIGNSGFFHRTDRLEALLVLYGTTQASNSSTAYSCAGPDDTSRKSYLPVRVSLRDGTYIIEGWVNPAATVTVEAALANASSRIRADSGGQWDDSSSDEVYSPLRLNRFVVDDENLARVLAYARIKKSSTGGKATARRIHWFRVSDLSPYYREQAPAGCAAAYAFFETFDAFGQGAAKGLCALGEPLPIGRDGLNADQITSDLYLDKMGRMGSTANATESYGGDDGCRSGASTGAGCGLRGGTNSGGGIGDENDWEYVTRQLAIINATATAKGSTGRDCSAGSGCSGREAARAAAFDALRERFGIRGAGLELTAGGISALPAGFGSLDAADTDVIGIIAGHGDEGWKDTVDTINNSPALKRFGSFVGETSDLGNTNRGDNEIVTPSFVLSEVGATTDAQQAWLEEHSALFGGSSKLASLMRFRTSAGAEGTALTYYQGPIGQIRINVTGGTLRGEGVTYSSDYLPLYAIGRPGGAGTVREGYLFFDPRNILQALNDFIVGIYQGTLGAALAELSQSAVDGLLATPGLNRFELDLSYSNPDRPIYQLNENVNREVARDTAPSDLPRELAKLDATEAACTYAAANGILNAPGNDDDVTPASFVYPEGSDTTAKPDTLHSVEECYVGNSVYGLFGISRAISLILFMALVARFFFRLGTGREREMGIVGFFARATIAMAIIFGAQLVLQFGALIVSETITLTNFFGTQLSDGRPYSYLWLFGGYLSRADVTAVNVFSLFLLAPFSLLGLLVLSIVTFLRSVFTVGIIVISPFWVIDLLYRAESRFFNRSLLLMMRLYLIPVLTLITLMFLFLFFPASTNLAQSQTEFGLFAAVLGLLSILLVVIVPIWGANQIVSRFGDRVIGGITKALKGARDTEKANFLEAGMRGEEGLKAFRTDVAKQDQAAIAAASSGAGAVRADAKGAGRAPGDPKQLGKGADGQAGDAGAAGSLVSGAAKAAGFVGAARGLIGAERGRPKTIAERLKGITAGAGTPKGAAIAGLGVAGKLTSWTTKTAARGMVGAEVTATRGYASTQLAAVREKVAARLLAAGVTDDTGAYRADTAQGRLAAAGAEIAGQAKSELVAAGTARLALARGAFMGGVDAERSYLDSSATIAAADIEAGEIRAHLESGAFKEAEAKAARTRLVEIAATVEGAERTRLESAAIMAAAAGSSTATVGTAVHRIRSSSVAQAIFGASPADAARTEAEANAAAAAAVTRRLEAEIEALRAEERAATAAGDSGAASTAAAALRSRSALRVQVEAERTAYLDDAVRRTQGGTADVAATTAAAIAAAAAATGRAGGTRAKQRIERATAALASIEEQVKTLTEQEASYTQMAASGVVLTDAPDFAAQRTALEARRAELTTEVTTASAAITSAATARQTAAIWSRAASGRLPDGTKVSVGPMLSPAIGIAGALAIGALAGPGGVAPGVVEPIGRSAGSAIGAALDARLAANGLARPASARPATPPAPTIELPEAPAPAIVPVAKPVAEPAVEPVAEPVAVPVATPVVAPARETTPPLTREAYTAPDWQRLIATGSAAEIEGAVRAGMAQGDPIANAIGEEGLRLIGSGDATFRTSLAALVGELAD